MRYGAQCVIGWMCHPMHNKGGFLMAVKRHGVVLSVCALMAITVGTFSRVTATSVWAIATPAVFPAGVEAPMPGSGIESVSCTSPGNCTAVGGYIANTQSDILPFTMTSTNGVWGNVRPAVFPNGVQSNPTESDFEAVSCTSPGNCTAVGKFYDSSNSNQAFTMTSINGTWGTATPVVFPNTAPFQSRTPNDRLVDVVCTSDGNCTAVGTFRDSNGTLNPFAVTSTNGTWGTATPIALPNNGAWAYTTGVSCASAGNCTAIGYVASSGGIYDAFTATSANGTWGAGTRAVFANGVQNATPDSSFSSVSCASAGNCTAVGFFYSAAGFYESMAMTSTNGTWANAQPATFANGVQSSTPEATLSAVSCASVGHCTAVGWFRNTGNHQEAFTMTSTNGNWGTATPAVFANGVQNSAPDAYFTTVSCVTADSCVAAGRFEIPGTGSRPMTMTSSAVVNNPTTTAPSATTTTTAPASNQSPSTSTTLPAPALAVVKALPKASTPIVANTSIATGEEITVSFGGFTPFEYVQLIVASTPKVIGSGYANAQGVVTITGSLPASLASGNHTLAVYAPVSGVGFSQPIAVSKTTLPATGSSNQSVLMAVALFLLLGGLLLRRTGRMKPV